MVWTWVWSPVRIVQMHARKQGVRSAIKKFQGDVSAHVSQHVVVADAECILGSEAVRVPAIDRGHRARIGRNKRRNREDAMAILAAARCQGRKHGVAQPGKYPLAFAAVVQGIFFESLGKRIPGGCSYCSDPKVGPEPPGIALDPLMPLRR